jgi:hypothetical protein
MRSPTVVTASLLALALAGCASNEEKLVDQRMAMRKALDGAYAAYGGGTMANQVRADAQKDPKQENQFAAQMAGEADRTMFEQYCIAAGSGERLFNFSAKLDAWLKDEKNLDLCKKAAKALLQVSELERKAAGG